MTGAVPSGLAADSILSLKYVPPGNGKPMLLDLGSRTCAPCKQMQPILDELKVTYLGKITTQVIDVFFDAKGKELYRHMGFLSKKDIVSKSTSLGML